MIPREKDTGKIREGSMSTRVGGVDLTEGHLRGARPSVAAASRTEVAGIVPPIAMAMDGHE